MAGKLGERQETCLLNASGRCELFLKDSLALVSRHDGLSDGLFVHQSSRHFFINSSTTNIPPSIIKPERSTLFDYQTATLQVP